MDKFERLRLRDCIGCLKNNYSDCVDTMDSILGLEDIISTQVQKNMRQQQEIERLKGGGWISVDSLPTEEKEYLIFPGYDKAKFKDGRFEFYSFYSEGYIDIHNQVEYYMKLPVEPEIG